MLVHIRLSRVIFRHRASGRERPSTFRALPRATNHLYDIVKHFQRGKDEAKQPVRLYRTIHEQRYDEAQLADVDVPGEDELIQSDSEMANVGVPGDDKRT